MTKDRRIDLSFGPGHGPISGVLIAAGAMLALTLWSHIADLPPAWGLAAGVLMAAASLVVAEANDQPEIAIWYRVICWTAAGVWSFSVRTPWPHPWSLRGLFLALAGQVPAQTPLTWSTFFSITIGAAVLAAVGWRIQKRQERDVAPATMAVNGEIQRPAPRNLYEEIINRWEPYIRRLTRVQLVVRDVEVWPIPDDLKGQPNPPRYYGFTLDCELPEGADIDDVKAYEKKLATSSPVPDVVPNGAGVEVVPHPFLERRHILIKVGMFNAVSRDINYPRDLLAMDTLDNPQPIGIRADGTRIEVPYDRSMTVVGDSGSGKSMQLDNLTVRGAVCSDVLLVGIDITGQGMAFRPWLTAHHEGRADRPTFAYVAPDAENARMLVASLLKIHDARLVGYRDLMRQHNTHFILPRVMGVPQIRLVVDEFKTLPSDVRDMIEQLTETGRKSAIRVTTGALQATVEYVAPGVVRQSAVRICMKVIDPAMIAYLFDSTWKRGRTDPATMITAGTGLCGVEAGVVEQFKGYFLPPNDIDEISRITAAWQPDLDEISLRAGDTVTVKIGPGETQTYTGVWSQAQARTYPIIFASAGAALPAGRTVPTGRAESMGSAEDNLDAAFGEVNKASSDLDQAMADLRKAADGPYEEPAGPSGPSADELNAWFNGPTVDEPTRAKPSAQVRVLQLLKVAAESGTGPTELHQVLVSEGYPTSRTTISEWLAKWKAQGVVDQPAGPGTAWFPGSKFPKV